MRLVPNPSFDVESPWTSVLKDCYIPSLAFRICEPHQFARGVRPAAVREKTLGVSCFSTEYLEKESRMSCFRTLARNSTEYAGCGKVTMRFRQSGRDEGWQREPALESVEYGSPSRSVLCLHSHGQVEKKPSELLAGGTVAKLWYGNT
jgi:hypothetical protein